MPQDNRSRPLEPELDRKTVLIAVQITYPGTYVTDLLVGGQKVQVSNEHLRLAAETALDEASQYDMGVNTGMLIGSEEHGPDEESES